MGGDDRCAVLEEPSPLVAIGRRGRDGCLGDLSRLRARAAGCFGAGGGGRCANEPLGGGSVGFHWTRDFSPCCTAPLSRRRATASSSSRYGAMLGSSGPHIAMGDDARFSAGAAFEVDLRRALAGTEDARAPSGNFTTFSFGPGRRRGSLAAVAASAVMVKAFSKVISPGCGGDMAFCEESSDCVLQTLARCPKVQKGNMEGT